MIPKGSIKSFLRAIVTIIVCLIGVCFFYWPEVKESFSMLIGDVGDTRLIVYVSNLWFEWFNGRLDSLYSPPFFYPATNVLGYSSALFFHGVFVSVLRFLGFNPFDSLLYVVMLFSVFNFYSAYFLIRKGCRLGFFPALVGASFFAFNSPLATHGNHQQLIPVFGLPLIWLCLLSWWRHTEFPSNNNSFKGFALLSVAALLMNAHLMTDIYAPWFMACFSLFFLLIMLAFERPRHLLMTRVRQNFSSIIKAVAVFAVTFLPFLYLYIPVARELGFRSYREVELMVPRLVSYVWMGPWNYAWKEELARIIPEGPNLSFVREHAIGVGICFSLIAIGSMLWGVKHIAKFVHKKSTGLPSNFFYQLLAVTLLAYFLISLQYDNWSPWKLVFKTIPGAKSIRAVSRGIIVLALPIAILSAFWVQRIADLVNLKKRIVRIPAQIVLSVVLLFGLYEQGTWMPSFNILTQQRDLATMASKIPKQCSSFYVTVEKNDVAHDFSIQLDAMLLSLYSSIPTLNGYSGKAPKGWDFYETHNQDYETRVQTWFTKHSLEQVCKFPLMPTRFN